MSHHGCCCDYTLCMGMTSYIKCFIHSTKPCPKWSFFTSEPAHIRVVYLCRGWAAINLNIEAIVRGADWLFIIMYTIVAFFSCSHTELCWQPHDTPETQCMWRVWLLTQQWPSDWGLVWQALLGVNFDVGSPRWKLKSKPEVKEKVRNLMVWITLVDYSQQWISPMYTPVVQNNKKK